MSRDGAHGEGRGRGQGGNNKGLPYTLAVITVLKGMIGSGVLGLPLVCGRLGLAVSAPGMAATAAIGGFSVWRLIQCKALVAAAQSDAAEQRRSLLLSGSTEGAAGAPNTYGLGPLAVVGREAFGVAGVVLAGAGVLLSQLGFAVSYVAVVVATLGSPSLLGSLVGKTALRLVVCGFLCALCLLRELRDLAWLSTGALLIYGYLLAALIFYGALEVEAGRAPDTDASWAHVDMRYFGTWFGSAIFSQEAIVISQYVYDDMRLERPAQFLPVLTSSFATSGALFTTVGVYGAVCYGDAVASVFYLSFPAGGTAVRVGEVALSLVLLLTFALQMYPVMSFLEATFLGDPGPDDAADPAPAAGSFRGGDECESSASSPASSSSSTRSAGPGCNFAVARHGARAAIRCAAVCGACAAAAVVPDLSCISGYVGSFALSLIGFFLPPLCHISLKRRSQVPMGVTDILGDALLLFTGVCALIAGITCTSCG